ncbi:MAG: transposase [Ardenticatenaceae bacterium]
MRVKRDYGPLESYHYYPEIKFCLHCEEELVRSHPFLRKTIISLNETAKVTNWGYCCQEDSCPPTIYRSAEADGLALKGYNFALDVIVFIGQERFNQHRNLTEIHSSLSELGVQISSRRVSDFFMTYELLLAATQVDKLRATREEIIQAGGVRLAIDGIQPQAGKEIVYIFRDVISGNRFGAVSLMHHDHKTLATEMRKIKDLLDSLDLPLRSIMTDHQEGLIKGIALVWPDVPHQLCQLHFLKALARPIGRQDSALAKKLKKQLRPIKDIERALNNKEESSESGDQDRKEENVAQLQSSGAAVSVPPSEEAQNITFNAESACNDNEDLLLTQALSTASELIDKEPLRVEGEISDSVPPCELAQNMSLNDENSLPTDPSDLLVPPDQQTPNSHKRPSEAGPPYVVSHSANSRPNNLADSLPISTPSELRATLPHSPPNQFLCLDSHGTSIIEPLTGSLTDPLLLAEPTHTQFCHLDRQLPTPNSAIPASSDLVEQARCEQSSQSNASTEALPSSQACIPDSASPKEEAKRQVLLGYCDAIRTLIQFNSLAPFSLAGLEIYEKMVQLSDSIIRCLSIQQDPTLAEIHSLLTPVYNFSQEYLTITRRQQYLLTFADLLDVPKTKAGDWCQTGVEVATEFEELLSDLPAYALLHPEDSKLLTFFEERSLDWMKGLFYCYEERDSPRTNNSLEQYNHFLKSQRRRVTG